MSASGKLRGIRNSHSCYCDWVSVRCKIEKPANYSFGRFCDIGIGLVYGEKYEVPDFNMNVSGVTGVAPPERMESVNMLLEALPCDVSEFMLTEYLNNMMQPDCDAEQ